MSSRKKFEKQNLDDLYDCIDVTNNACNIEPVEQPKKEDDKKVMEKIHKQGRKFKNMFASFTKESKKDSEKNRTRRLSYSEISNPSSSQLDILDTGPGFSLIELKYLPKETNIKQFSYYASFEDFKIGDLVRIHSERNLFGRIQFFITDGKDYFMGIGITDVSHASFNGILEQILFVVHIFGKPFHGIVVHSVYVEKFDHPLNVDVQPFLSEKSFKFVEEIPGSELLNGKYIKLSTGNSCKYGQVSKTLRINGEVCLEIFLVKDGSTKVEQKYYLKNSSPMIVKNLRLELQYYDGVIIFQDSIVKIEPSTKESWRIGRQAVFILRSSGETFFGKIKEIVIINDVLSAVVELNKSEKEKIFDVCVLRKEFLEKFNCEVNQASYLIPLSMIRMDNSKDLFAIIKFMLEKDEMGSEEVINESIKMADETILPFLINHIRGEIDLDKTPELLHKLFERKDVETLGVLLTKSRSGVNSDQIFLEMAYTCLQAHNKILFSVIIDKCSNRNLLLPNNETFLTNLFKTDTTEDVIIDIIKDDKFDISQPNGDGETPLVLASQKLMLSTMGLILKSPKINQNELSRARDIILDGDNNISVEEAAKRFRAAILLKRDLPENMCSICMDRMMNVSLNCGHRFCKQCSDKFMLCAICNQTIVSRTKLYN